MTDSRHGLEAETHLNGFLMPLMLDGPASNHDKNPGGINGFLVEFLVQILGATLWILDEPVLGVSGCNQMVLGTNLHVWWNYRCFCLYLRQNLCNAS